MGTGAGARAAAQIAKEAAKGTGIVSICPRLGLPDRLACRVDAHFSRAYVFHI